MCSLPIILYFMYELLGTAGFVGVGAFLFQNVVAQFFSWAQEPFVRKLQERRDRRAEAVSQLMSGMLIVKVYGCEEAWGARVALARERELVQLRNVQYMSAAASLFCGLLYQLVPISIFSWYILVERRTLDAPTAFTALAWINQMNWSISVRRDRDVLMISARFTYDGGHFRHRYCPHSSTCAPRCCPRCSGWPNRSRPRAFASRARHARPLPRTRALAALRPPAPARSSPLPAMGSCSLRSTVARVSAPRSTARSTSRSSPQSRTGCRPRRGRHPAAPSRRRFRRAWWPA